MRWLPLVNNGTVFKVPLAFHSAVLDNTSDRRDATDSHCITPAILMISPLHTAREFTVTISPPSLQSASGRFGVWWIGKFTLTDFSTLLRALTLPTLIPTKYSLKIRVFRSTRTRCPTPHTTSQVRIQKVYIRTFCLSSLHNRNPFTLYTSQQGNMTTFGGPTDRSTIYLLYAVWAAGVQEYSHISAPLRPILSYDPCTKAMVQECSHIRGPLRPENCAQQTSIGN